MATLSISWTIADAQVAGIKNDFAAQLGWTATIPDPASTTPGQPQGTIPNPESQNAFIKRIIGEFIKSTVKARRIDFAKQTASDTENANVDATVILT